MYIYTHTQNRSRVRRADSSCKLRATFFTIFCGALFICRGLFYRVLFICCASASVANCRCA